MHQAFSCFINNMFNITISVQKDRKRIFKRDTAGYWGFNTRFNSYRPISEICINTNSVSFEFRYVIRNSETVFICPLRRHYVVRFFGLVEKHFSTICVPNCNIIQSMFCSQSVCNDVFSINYYTMLNGVHTIPHFLFYVVISSP